MFPGFKVGGRWTGLLVAQGRHRSHLGGASGREVGGEQRRDSKDGWSQEEHEWLARAHLEEHALHDAPKGKGEREAKAEADGRQREPLAHEEPEHAARRRAERETDADLPRPPRHHVPFTP